MGSRAGLLLGPLLGPLLGMALLSGCSRQPERPREIAYAPPRSCQPCHAAIFETYRNVAMARSLYRPSRDNVVEDYTRNNHFHHAASGRDYRMIEREGRFYQRRYQLDAQGREVNALEQEITHIIGSGNHARSYLHLSESGELTELPITWYPQERRWAMSPGYDNPKHPDFSRPIDYGCFFCHDAYPALPAGADRYGAEARFPNPLPEGIDCQRCHGPGTRHIELASGGRAPAEAIRAAIVNPAKLSPALQMDVCQQCHLEITSAKLPQAVRRFGRPAFSFRPGQRLTDYLVYFDHPPGAGHDDKFEISSAAYRLRKSACFQKSAGRLTCITCHNPHRTPRGEEAVAQFRERCRSCHSQVAVPHPDLAASNCISCHMPQRRTDDVVHVVMTDHFIQRRKPARDLLAPLQEKDVAYHGDVVLYDPPQLAQPERDLYAGIALAMDGADRARGISVLEKGIAAAGKAAPLEAQIELAAAYTAERNPRAAADAYRKALQIDPGLPKLHYNLGRALDQFGDAQGAREQYEQALRGDPNLPEAHNNLAALLARTGEVQRATDEFQSAIRARPINAEAHDNLGNLYAGQGRLGEAQTEIEAALQADPAFPSAYNNLGKALGLQGRLDLAIGRFERAVQLDPNYAEARYNLGRTLHAQGKRDAAIAEYRRVIQLNPSLAQAHLSLGVALGEKGQVDAAIEQFREALRLRPDDREAQSDLQLALEMKSTRR